MTHHIDTWTTTLDGARGHAEQHAELYDPPDDRPDPADLARQGLEDRAACPECRNGRTYVAEVDEGGRPVLHCDRCEWFS